MVGVEAGILSAAARIGGQIAKNASLRRRLFNAIRLNRHELRDLILDDEIRFLGYCLGRRELSRSQIMQDLWVCYELGEKPGGYFVEFGATNGKRNSNTWLLETRLGWRGILAEPNPIWHADLARNRSAHIERRCVSSSSGDIVPFLTTNDSDPELSAIVGFAGADHFADTRSRGERIEVETISLDDLLDAYRAPELIDYISIDTEGSELDILSAYSFRHRFRTISVEINPSTEEPLHALLVSKGYRRVFENFSQWDSWYVAADLRTDEPPVIAAPEA